MPGANELFEVDIREELQKAQATNRKAAAQAYAVFNTEEGAALLEHLRETFINRPVLTADSTPMGAGIREGQNSLVRYLEWLIMEHKQAHNIEEHD